MKGHNRLKQNPNKTFRYLWPIVNLFGKTFLRELGALTSYANYEISDSIVRLGVGDFLFYRAKGHDIRELLFCIIDVNGCYDADKDKYIDVNKGKQRFKDFLKYIRNSPYYYEDYWYRENQHCIVFNLEKFNDTYRAFFKSEYSKMYDKKRLNDVNITPFVLVRGKKQDSAQYAVLTKDERVGITVLKERLYEEFGTRVLPDNPTEYDTPWMIKHEFFNFNYAEHDEIEKVTNLKNGKKTEKLV